VGGRGGVCGALQRPPLPPDTVRPALLIGCDIFAVQWLPALPCPAAVTAVKAGDTVMWRDIQAPVSYLLE
jgi:hypothetical protein